MGKPRFSANSLNSLVLSLKLQTFPSMGKKKKQKSYPAQHIPAQGLEDLIISLDSSTATSFPLPSPEGITHQAYIQEGSLGLVTTFPVANPEACRVHINKVNFDACGYVCRTQEGLRITTAAPCPDKKYQNQVRAQVAAHNDTIDRLLRLILP